jgi:TolB-like protein
VLFRFEDYSLDASRRELRRGSDLVAMEPLAFDLLELLVRNRRCIVSKDDLIREVWNRRVVSDSTLSSRMTAVRHAIGDSGKQQRLIKTLSRRGFRFVGNVHEELERDQEIARPTLEGTTARPPRKPAIAVLPFAGTPRRPDQEDFVNGLVEDITTALSQFPWLSVVARSSSFAFKGWAVDISRVRHDLGVHYALEGSVRRRGRRVRITARLIDTVTGTHLWAKRFDARHQDILDLQDQLSAKVIGAIGARLEQIEIDRARREPPDRLGAMDCYLRGLGALYQWSRDGISNALGQFHRAIEIDPEFASAYAMAAYCYVQRKSYGWIVDRPAETAECVRLAQQAAELAKDDAVALSKAAHAIASVAGDIDSGAAFIDKALALNPNLPAAWYVSGWIKLFLGERQPAIEHLARAMRLSPFDPLIFKIQAALAYAHFFSRRYDEASAAAARALHARPCYLTALRGAAASHALAGRVEEAHRLMSQMHELDPALCLSNLEGLIPFHRSQDFGKWADALRRAGLPD